MSTAKRQSNFLSVVLGLAGATLSAALCPAFCMGAAAGPKPTAFSASEASVSAIRRADAYFNSREDLSNLREAVG
ncbi:MAG: hypothetical protein ACRD10_07585, partial [Terriglobia bacterium]